MPDVLLIIALVILAALLECIGGKIQKQLKIKGE